MKENTSSIEAPFVQISAEKTIFAEKDMQPPSKATDNNEPVLSEITNHGDGDASLTTEVGMSPTSVETVSTVAAGSSGSVKSAQTPPPTMTEKHLAGLFRGLQRTSAPLEDRVHVFWDTQPVPKMNDVLPTEPLGPIDTSKTVESIRPEPYPLPAPFLWVTCNVMDDKELEEIYSLLNLNYVEDDDNMFRFDYSKEFLRWALTVPGYNPEWHIGVRTDKGKLVAFITGIPANVSIYKTPVKLAEINFLCVHKKLRSKRLAPVLIKEVTRRVNRTGIWQAVYTAGVVLPKPVSECTYYHRSLNIRKLVEVRFTTLGPRTTMSLANRLYKVPEKTTISGLRPMEEKDTSQVLALLNSRFEEETHLYPIFTEEDVRHILLPKKDVVISYVREQAGKVTDFFSFYILPSSVIGNPKYTTLNAAYSYYNVATSVSLVELISDALVVAKQAGMDVFNALDLHKNLEFIRELKFGKGDGSLRYYLYNYLCPVMPPSGIGLVML